MSLDKTSKTPLYQQLAATLKDKIDTGEWLQGMIIPTEKELSAQFEVSRITVRQAIKILVDTLYLQARAGFGTQVYRPHQDKLNLTYTQSYTNEIREMRKDNRTLSSQLDRILADETLATIFHVAMGTELYCLKRIRGTETERIVYSETYLRPIVTIPTTPDVLFGSLYSYLISQGFYFHRFEESISARKVNEDIVEKLTLTEPISLVRIRLGFDQHHQLIEYTINYYNPAYYEYRNIIESQKGVRP